MFLAIAMDDARMLVDRGGVWRDLRRREAALRRRGRKLDGERKKRGAGKSRPLSSGESMTRRELRKAERKRLVRRVIAHVDEFPRQHEALAHAMQSFGGDFDLRQFKDAFETVDDMDAYNRVQTVERALGRVQGFVDDMACDGVRLADLRSDPLGGEGFRAKTAFEALRQAKIIDGHLTVVACSRGKTPVQKSSMNTCAFGLGSCMNRQSSYAKPCTSSSASTGPGSSRFSTNRGSPATKSGGEEANRRHRTAARAVGAAVAPARLSYGTGDLARRPASAAARRLHRALGRAPVPNGSRALATLDAAWRGPHGK